MYYVSHYVIDWDKVQSLEDVKRLLKAMNVAFEIDNPKLEEIIDLVKLEPK